MSLQRHSFFLKVLLFCPLWCAAGAGLGAGPQWCGTPTPIASKVLQVHDQLSLTRGPLFSSKQVIRDEGEWKKLIASHPELAKLKVNFQKHMVLAYGETPRGRGKHFSFATVTDVGGHLRAEFHFGFDPPWQPQFQDIIWPSHFVVVNRSDKDVIFVEQTHPEWELDSIRFPAEEWNPTPKVQVAAGQQSTQPKLTFAIEGADLVVTTTITANNSPHVLQTSTDHDPVSGKTILKYVLIQNSDLLVRSQKQIQVTWRLTGMAAIPAKQKALFHVEAVQLLMNTQELSDLVPKLADLKQAGAKFQQATQSLKAMN